MHGGDERPDPAIAATGDFVVHDGGAGTYRFRQGGPALPKAGGMQQRRARNRATPR
jgi:hypothetical protein